MQQLTIEHKKVKTTSQKVVNNEELVVENQREVKGRTLATSHNVYRSLDQ